MSETSPLSPGVKGSATLTVSDRDTAIAMGSGDVAVLATPRVVALAEQAAYAAVAPRLPPESTSVGVRMEVDHLQPTPVGRTVTATAILTAVEGRKLDFEVAVQQGDTEVARARHRRVIAPRDAFPAS